MCTINTSPIETEEELASERASERILQSDKDHHRQRFIKRQELTTRPKAVGFSYALLRTLDSCLSLF